MSQAWRKVLLYFGLMEDDEFDRRQFSDEEEDELEEPVPDRQNVRKLQRRDARSVVRPVPTASAAPYIFQPKSFDDAQQLADKFKAEIPVVLNLQGLDQELCKRLLDFAIGLTYGLHGTMQRAGERVFLLTPSNMEVSADDKRRLQERGFFYNQL